MLKKTSIPHPCRQRFLPPFVITVLLLTIGLLGGSSLNQPSAQAAHEDFAALQALMDTSDQQGAVRVLVSLDLAVAPESSLSDLQIQVQRERIVKIQDRVLDRLGEEGVRSPERLRTIPALALELDAQRLALLPTLEEVRAVRKDLVIATSLDESIPLIGGITARQMGYTGQGQVVAVLDTGVDSEHPFLRGKVVSEACYSTTSSIEGSTTVCPNGKDEQLGHDAALPCGLPGCDHGTHVAGIAAGRGDDFSGAAPDASIVAIQVSSQFSGPSCTDYGLSSPCVLTFTSDMMRALEHVYTLRTSMNIAAINVSLGGGSFSQTCDSEYPDLTDLVDNLRTAGIAVVAASGNEGAGYAMNWPACVASVISVGATDMRDGVASFSNASSFLDVLAPGGAIRSSVPGGGYESWDGTSMAVPHIVGSIAMLRSKRSDGSVDELLGALRESGVGIVDGRNGLTYPRVQVDSALIALEPDITPTPTATATRMATLTPTATPTSTPLHYTFADVPPDHRYYHEVEILFDQGYSKGCQEEPQRLYCVDDALGRDEIAVFVERGIHGAEHVPPFPADPYFLDVSLEDWFVEWVDGLWADEYTDGCSSEPPYYCPAQQNTNAEACVFFLRMKYGADYEPADAPNVFSDVDPEAWYAPWVASAWKEGIIEPCAEEPDLEFCPEDPISRGAAAYMMARAKGLLP